MQEEAPAPDGGKKEQLIGSETRPRLTNSSFSERRLAMRYAGNEHFRICIHQTWRLVDRNMLSELVRAIPSGS